MKITYKGFTLIELLVVVFFLAALSAFALPFYIGSIATSKLDDANRNLKALKTAIQYSYLSTGAATYSVYAGAPIAISGTTGVYSSKGNFAAEIGGSLPINPCTGVKTDWTAIYTATTGAGKLTITGGVGGCPVAPITQLGN